jgi:flagellar FliJ protein
MKFEFTYQKLLEHRKRLEELAAKAYSDAQYQVDLSRDKLNELYKQVEETRKNILQFEQEGGRSSSVMIQGQEFIVGQKIRIQKQQKELQELLHAAENKQEDLQVAARERKTLEKLKDRQLQEFKVRLKKKEMKEVDDLVTMRFGTNAGAVHDE